MELLTYCWRCKNILIQIWMVVRSRAKVWLTKENPQNVWSVKTVTNPSGTPGLQVLLFDMDWFSCFWLLIQAFLQSPV